jgi:type III restriction enzyme/adenine-specific DNA-methyltransferase
MENLNDFFKGKITPAGIPKIKGIKKAGTLLSFVMVLLKMADLLGATEAPKDEATKELRELLPTVKFTPKPTRLLAHLFKVANISSGDIVVDFFSGSGTTAHAVMQLNAEDGGNRQYIIVQLPEKCPEKSAAFTAGYKTIDEIGQARIKKAAAKIAEENPLLAKTMDLGFKHYTLKEVEGKTLDKIEKFDLNDNALAATDDILKEFGVETVLATWLVHDGYGFGAEPKVVDLDGYKAYWMEKHVYLIEPGLSDKGISALFDKFETDGTFNPGNVVVFGYSFSWTQLEALKNNLLKIAANGTNKHVLLDKRY